MRELTKQEAERCARACGYKNYVEAIEAEWESRPDDLGKYYTDSWFEDVGTHIVEHENLPLDPYFWFGRLWDRLEELADGICFEAYILDGGRVYDIRFMGGGVGPHLEPCLALCEAIGKLTK